MDSEQHNEMELFDHHMRKALAYAQQIRDFTPLAELREKLEEQGE